MIETIRFLAQEVRAATLITLQRVPEDWLLWAPTGTSNHILWHAGHALFAQEELTLKPLIGGNRLPAGWEDSFGDQCRPVSATQDWPPREEVVELLKLQLEDVLQALNENADELLTNPSRHLTGEFWPLHNGILHGWHDEARHQGEMHLLWKMQKAARG